MILSLFIQGLCDFGIMQCTEVFHRSRGKLLLMQRAVNLEWIVAMDVLKHAAFQWLICIPESPVAVDSRTLLKVWLYSRTPYVHGIVGVDGGVLRLSDLRKDLSSRGDCWL